MKKIMIAFSTALVLAACGTGNTAATTTADSTKTTVDSTKATVDTTAKQDTSFYKKENAERKAEWGVK